MVPLYLEKTCPNCGKQFQSPKYKYPDFCCHKCALQFNAAKRRTGTVTSQGYKVIATEFGRMTEHRYVMQKHLGRPLLRTEIVHHKDGNKLNNDISNLQLVGSIGKHNTMHAVLFRSETHKECNVCNKVKPRTEFYVRRRRSKNADTHRADCKECAKTDTIARSRP